MAHASFWPNRAHLAISISLMDEGGGQPISGAPGVIPEPIRSALPDMPTNGIFQYGIYEGTPRLLDLFDNKDEIAEWALNSKWLALPWKN
jgi:hypothetical protein